MSAAAIIDSPLTTVRLSGQLRQFGKAFELAVRTPREAIKALCVQLPGFERFLANASSKGLEFAVYSDKRNVGEAELDFQARDEIRIVPVVAGSKRAGSLQTIIGVVLIAVAAIATQGSSLPFTAGGWGTMATMGFSMAMGGVMQLASPQPKGLEYERRAGKHTGLCLWRRPQHHGLRQPGGPVRGQAALGWSHHQRGDLRRGPTVSLLIQEAICPCSK